MTPESLPDDWRRVLAAEFEKPYFADLVAFLEEERETQTVYPPEAEVFSAFAATPFDKVRVLLLGQDPYHGPGQAHGMCFSVKPGVTPPPSLANMYREIRDEFGCPVPATGNLTSWATQGVLLINAVMTVRDGEANSHKGRGWETFTDAVIKALDAREAPVAFLLLGGYAQKKEKLVKQARHRVLKFPHPSPMPGSKFRGSKPFSATNAALAEMGGEGIEWCVKG